MAWNKREILAIYMRIVASEGEENEEEEGVINCPDTNIARASEAKNHETYWTA